MESAAIASGQIKFILKHTDNGEKLSPLHLALVRKGSFDLMSMKELATLYQQVRSKFYLPPFFHDIEFLEKDRMSCLYYKGQWIGYIDDEDDKSFCEEIVARCRRLEILGVELIEPTVHQYHLWFSDLEPDSEWLPLIKQLRHVEIRNENEAIIMFSDRLVHVLDGETRGYPLTQDYFMPDEPGCLDIGDEDPCVEPMFSILGFENLDAGQGPDEALCRVTGQQLIISLKGYGVPVDAHRTPVNTGK